MSGGVVYLPGYGFVPLDEMTEADWEARRQHDRASRLRMAARSVAGCLDGLATKKDGSPRASEVAWIEQELGRFVDSLQATIEGRA